MGAGVANGGLLLGKYILDTFFEDSEYSFTCFTARQRIYQ